MLELKAVGIYFISIFIAYGVFNTVCSLIFSRYFSRAKLSKVAILSAFFFSLKEKKKGGVDFILGWFPFSISIAFEQDSNTLRNVRFSTFLSVLFLIVSGFLLIGNNDIVAYLIELLNYFLFISSKLEFLGVAELNYTESINPFLFLFFTILVYDVIIKLAAIVPEKEDESLSIWTGIKLAYVGLIVYKTLNLAFTNFSFYSWEWLPIMFGSAILIYFSFLFILPIMFNDNVKN